MRKNVMVMIAVALAFAGCGSDDESDAVGPAEFERRVNALCSDEHERVDAMFKDFPDEPTREDVQALIGMFAGSFREYRDELVEVGPPEGREADYEDYIDVVGTHLAKLDRGADDPEEAERLFNEEGEDPLAEVERKLGLDVCASR